MNELREAAREVIRLAYADRADLNPALDRLREALAAPRAPTCPDCGGLGYYATGPTDAPVQTQCQRCGGAPRALEGPPHAPLEGGGTLLVGTKGPSCGMCGHPLHGGEGCGAPVPTFEVKGGKCLCTFPGPEQLLRTENAVLRTENAALRALLGKAAP